MADHRVERGICELYEEDPERADFLIFGRRAHADRRGFLRGAGLAACRPARGRDRVRHLQRLPLDPAGSAAGYEPNPLGPSPGPDG